MRRYKGPQENTAKYSGNFQKKTEYLRHTGGLRKMAPWAVFKIFGYFFLFCISNALQCTLIIRKFLLETVMYVFLKPVPI
jgi:hypothetical protein